MNTCVFVSFFVLDHDASNSYIGGLCTGIIWLNKVM